MASDVKVPEVVVNPPDAPGNGEAPAAPNGNGQALAQKAPAAPARPLVPVTNFDPDDMVSLFMNTHVFDQLQRVGNMLAKSGMVPAHLQEKVAACSLVAAQAIKWRMDPLSVAQGTFELDGKLGYEGKLIAAVINTSGKLEGRLRFVYSGDKKSLGRTITVIGRIKGEAEDREVDGSVDDWRTDRKGSPWGKPAQWDQMLAFRGAREWARRHLSEVMLGIHDADDLAAISEREERTVRDVTPKAEAQPAGNGHAEAAQPDPLFAMAQAQAASTKCDGDHGAPRCGAAQGQCWHDEPPQEVLDAIDARAKEATAKLNADSAPACDHNPLRMQSKANPKKVICCATPGCGAEFKGGVELSDSQVTD